VTFIPVVVAVALSSGAYVRTRTQAGGPFLFWNQNAVTYHQDSLGNPENVADEEFTAVTQSFANWQAALAACGSLNFYEGPRVSSRRAAYSEDGNGQQNVVLFRQRQCNDVAPSDDACWGDEDCYNKYDCWGGTGYLPGTIALTTTTFDSTTGQILDADIELNSERFYFTTANTPQCPSGVFSQSCVASDIENTMTHEIGHLLGLDHASDPSSTMFASAPLGETSKRSLDADSLAFVCDVYPSNATFTAQAMDDVVGNSPGCASVAGAGMLPPLMYVFWALASRRRRRER